MVNQLIQCVPNFSEGRRFEVIESIIGPFKQTKGCNLLDHRADGDHNRLVVTLVGPPGPIQDALIQAAKIAINHIDLNTHQGGHPRVGAVDVIPFVPLRNITMDECVALAHTFGECYHKETGIPVYFYEAAAKRPDRARLEVVRRGQYEVLKTEAAENPDRHPDVGGPGLHATAGATVVGARKFLIAFNVNLDTKDLKVAQTIARFVRSSSGGLCHIKGIGLSLEERGMTQISMNLVDFEKNSLYRVVEMIRMEANRWGVNIVETEIYGMIPAEAILDSAAYYLQLRDFSAKQVVEMSLLDLVEQEE